MIVPKKRGEADQRGTKQPEYYLQVSLKLGIQSVDEFYALAGSVLKTIQGVQGMTLRLTGESLSRTELFHLWSLRSPNDLREAMVRLSDNPDYGRLDRLIISEAQEITTPMGLTRAPELFPKPRPGQRFLQVTGHLASADLAEFEALNEVRVPELARAGWYFMGMFLNLTGRLNTVTSVWGLEGNLPVSGKAFYLLPGVRMLGNVSANEWRVTDYQPQ
jgi:hypothetical protein